MHNRHLLPTRISSLLFASAVVFSWSALAPSLASAGSFKLNASHTDTTNNNPNGNGLGRGDVVPQGDPFSGGEEPPAQPDFTVKQDAPPPPPKKAFPLSANDQGGDGFDPKYGQGIPADQLGGQAPTQQMPGQAQGQPNFQMQIPNPDSVLAWDEWHQRVANAIYSRYTMLTRGAGYGMRHMPLQCNVTYVVTCQGQIINAQVQVQSRDPVYNTLCLGAVTSLSGNFPVLQFPAGSRRQYVEMPATFSENMNGHQGFRYLQGDHETIKGGR